MSSAEVVFTMPALLLLVFLAVQFGLYAHAGHVALAAAQAGSAEARRYDGHAAAAREETVDYLGQLGPTLLRDVQIQVDRSPEQATVVVEADVMSIVPGFTFTVRESASGPVERFVP